MKASFKSIATTFKKLFAKEVKPANKKPTVWESPKVVIPVKEYNKTGVSHYHGNINEETCKINKVSRRRTGNKMAKKSRQINRKAA